MVLHFQRTRSMKALTPVQYCIGIFPLQFKWLQVNSISVYTLYECLELECNFIYRAFVTEFPTTPIIAMSDIRKCTHADSCFGSEIIVFCVASCPPSFYFYHYKNCCNKKLNSQPVQEEPLIAWHFITSHPSRQGPVSCAE